MSVAGFLIQVPSEFWPFVDSYFLSSHFARFSIFIALWLLAARYSTEALSSFLTFVSILICILWCFSSGKRRRLLRVKGTAIIASDNPPRAVWSMRDKFGNVDPKNVRLSVKYATGLTFFTRYLSEEIEHWCERYAFLIQTVSVVLVMSTVYMTLVGGIFLVIIGIYLLSSLKPMFFLEEWERILMTEKGSRHRAFAQELVDASPLKKLSLIFLTLSFLSGMFHFASLSGRELLFTNYEQKDATFSIVMATSSGILLRSKSGEFQFLAGAKYSFSNTRP